MGKKTGRHGLIWSKVDRIQTAPDMRREVLFEKSPRLERELKNAYRL
jgi:hypothetical protein